MKVKRVILTLVILVGLLGVFAPVAGAAPAWYFVTVNTTGIGWGYTLINATDTASSPAFTNRYFVVDPNVAKQFLAVALTAISNGSVVRFIQNLLSGRLLIVFLLCRQNSRLASLILYGFRCYPERKMTREEGAGRGRELKGIPELFSRRQRQ